MRRSTPEVQNKEGYTYGLKVNNFFSLQKGNLSRTRQSCLPKKQGPAAGWLVGGTLPLWKAAAHAELRTQFKPGADSYGLSQMSLQGGCGSWPCRSPAALLAAMGHPGCPTPPICLLNQA